MSSKAKIQKRHSVEEDFEIVMPYSAMFCFHMVARNRSAALAKFKRLFPKCCLQVVRLDQKPHFKFKAISYRIRKTDPGHAFLNEVREDFSLCCSDDEDYDLDQAEVM
jgi:hypothetical protein